MLRRYHVYQNIPYSVFSQALTELVKALNPDEMELNPYISVEPITGIISVTTRTDEQEDRLRYALATIKDYDYDVISGVIEYDN